MLDHFVLDYTEVDADCTWVITDGDRAIGKISHYPIDGAYRITEVTPGVKAPKFMPHCSLAAAIEHLHDLRLASPALHVRPSGLTGLQESVLLAEAEVAEGAKVRDAAAADLGLSPTSYLQILLGLARSPLAHAFRPAVVDAVNAERERKLGRRPGRQRSAQAAA